MPSSDMSTTPTTRPQAPAIISRHFRHARDPHNWSVHIAYPSACFLLHDSPEASSLVVGHAQLTTTVIYADGR
jgi:hypothetical protein